MSHGWLAVALIQDHVRVNGPFSGGSDLLRFVQSLVPDEVAEEGEVLSTLGAVEPLLPCVDALVHLQVGGGGELLPTVWAGVGSLPCMNHQVALQAADLGEAFPALLTTVGLLARVDALVGT